jgi:PIN domain nuclease of toxin-antitoxin system
MPGIVVDTHALVWYLPDLPDRIIAATALRLNLPLVTRDRKIQASQVNSIW